MNRFFSPDNFIMKTLSLFCELMYLNFLFLLCCIPIFTIGASLSAMYTVAFKMIHKESPSISKEFFKAFRSEFKQATLIWVPAACLLTFFGYDVFIVITKLDAAYKFFQYPILVCMFIIVAVLIYVFPQIAVFNTPTKQLLKNSALLCIANFPTTLFYIIVHALLLGIADISGKCLVMTGSLLLFFGFAAIAYFFSLFFRRIFIKLTNGELDI